MILKSVNFEPLLPSSEVLFNSPYVAQLGVRFAS